MSGSRCLGAGRQSTDWLERAGVGQLVVDIAAVGTGREAFINEQTNGRMEKQKDGQTRGGCNDF